MVANRTTDTLLIADNFFGYAKQIKEGLENSGRTVAWYPDRPSQSSLSKVLLRLAPRLLGPRVQKYFNKMIGEVSQQPIRDVLIIKGETLSPAILKQLRQALPSARFTLYFWDSYRNMPRDSREKVGLVDRAFTFDPNDARLDSRLTYRPLFYADAYRGVRSEQTDIDILFVGTVHTDRYSVISKVKEALPSSVNLVTVLFFPSKWLFWARKVFDSSFRGARFEDFTFSPLSGAQVRKLVGRARIVLDIERPIQSGLTMRTLEILGASRKLITTNASVRDADFYDSRNILTIDRLKPVISPGFLRDEYFSPGDEIVENYSLTAWLEIVLPTAAKELGA